MTPICYITNAGCWGLVGNHYMLFATYNDYCEYMEEKKND